MNGAAEGYRTGRRAATLGLFVLTACWGAPPFTDSDLASLLQAGETTLVYAVSETMPLSLAGISEIQDAAENLGVPVVVLVDSGASRRAVRESIAGDRKRPRLFVQASEMLRGMGIGFHYPTLLIADGGRVLDDLVPGYKTAAAYEALVIEALGWPWEDEYRIARRFPFLPDLRGEFFKPVPGSTLVAIGWSRPGYFLDLPTGGVTPMGEGVWGDPGITPDGKYLTIVFPGQGLRWFSVDAMLRGDARPLLHETGLQTYQSMGRLDDTGRYRVLVAETSSARPTGLLVRDYHEVTTGPSGQTQLVPAGEWTPVCDDFRISLPMLSKGGTLVSGVRDGTMRVFRLTGAALSCAEQWNTGMPGGKAEFSSDDSRIVFVSHETAREGTPSGDVLVIGDLADASAEVVYRHPGSGDLWFPAFIGAEELVVLDRAIGGLLVLERRRRVTSRSGLEMDCDAGIESCDARSGT